MTNLPDLIVDDTIKGVRDIEKQNEFLKAVHTGVCMRIHGMMGKEDEEMNKIA